MTNLKLRAAVAALALILPVAASAQQLPQAVVGVVDTDRVFRECTVCAAANTALQGQLTQLQQRSQALAGPLQTEGTAIETQLRALPQGQQPNQALAQRIQQFQSRQQAAQQEVGTRQQQIERNVAFVRQQIGQRIQPAVQQVMQQRGATIVLDAGSALAASPAIDLTPAVLAIVNQNGTPLNLNAPAPQQPAQPAQQQPRPQGR